MNNETLNILEISSSARMDGSISRTLSRDLIAALEARHGSTEITHRDLSKGVPLLDDAWIEANFTPDEARTGKHKDALAKSDELVRELQNADVLLIGVPIYNFTISASLKAWIDMIARARVTFRYTDDGPRGLLKGKKAYLLVASGGVPVGSPMDFATPYLRHALSFVGITDVEIIAADKSNSDLADAMDRARSRIAELVHLPANAA